MYIEIAGLLEISENDVKESIRNSGRHVSMDAPLVENGKGNWNWNDSDTMYDVLRSDDGPTPETELLRESLKKEINRSLSTLTEKERDVINLYFGLKGSVPWTLEEIGEKFDLTRERVRQIKEKAIRRLKHNSRSKLLKAYLG
jgi:RNA polymerase primary sigma factor